MKRITKPDNLKSLPSNLLTMEIFARLTVSDLFNVKLSCKDFHGVPEDRYVLEHVYIDTNKFPLIPWHITDGASSFLARFKECNNPRMMYRQGMVDFFSRVNMESGLCSLRTAAVKGHVEASYVLGMILMCGGQEYEDDGLKILSGIKLLRFFVSYEDCRNKVKEFIRRMWVSDRVVNLLGRLNFQVKSYCSCGSIGRKASVQG